MEPLMKAVNKITNVTKLRKDQLLIMVLAGILLCVIALPLKKKNSSSSHIQSNIADSNTDIMEKMQVVQAEQEQYDLSYTDYWEQKLEQALACIEGAGSVEVLITLRESEEKILEKDVPEEMNETIEADAEGGSRTITERKTEEATVYTVNEAGQNVPYVSKVIQPVVEGVVVIAQGGDSEIVKQNIIETIQVLFGLDANKIRVVKGKTNNN